MVGFCGVCKMSICTSIVSKLLHSKWVFLQEITHDIVMLGRNVLFYTEKIISYVFLHVTAEKRWQNVLC